MLRHEPQGTWGGCSSFDRNGGSGGSRLREKDGKLIGAGCSGPVVEMAMGSGVQSEGLEIWGTDGAGVQVGTPEGGSGS